MVRDEGFRLFCGPFIYQCRILSPRSTETRRFGIVASRRVGNAVRRNFGKRVFREILRKNEGSLPGGCEVVVILRNGFENYSFAELEARFMKACRNTTAHIVTQNAI